MSAFLTLIDLSKRKIDQAAAKLGASIQQHTVLAEKLVLLEKYREEYHVRMHHLLETGCHMQQMRNFQLFMQKLDEAITGQHKLVVQAEHHISLARQALLKEEQKKMSYSVLVERHEHIRLKTMAKEEQKQNDEYGTKQFFYARQSSTHDEVMLPK